MPRQYVLLSLSFGLAVAGCGDGATQAGDCGDITRAFRFPTGSADGHPDPAGAKAAGQARAGRITLVAGPGKRYEATVDLPRDGAKHFVVFHAASEVDLAPVHTDRKPFALSNPIFY